MERMTHSVTETLFGYWQSICEDGLPPVRENLKPEGIVGILPQVFILEKEGDAAATFRLAGGSVCHLHMRELRGARFKDLFTYTSRSELDRIFGLVQDARPHVLRTSVRSDRGFAELETALLPLRVANGEIARIVGSMSATTSAQSLWWVGSYPVSRHEIRSAAELPWSGRRPDPKASGEILRFSRDGAAEVGRMVATSE